LGKKATARLLAKIISRIFSAKEKDRLKKCRRNVTRYERTTPAFDVRIARK